MNYATLYELREYISLEAGMVGDDERLRGFLRWSSKFIDDIRRCDVRRETRLYDYPVKKRSGFGVYSVDEWVALANSAADLSSGILRLDDDLLAVDSITNGDDTTVTSAQYVLQPANLYPKSRIKLKGSSGVAWQPDSLGDREQCISVVGFWGWHPDYDESMEDSGDSIQNDPSLSSSGTAVSVSDADGATIYGMAQRFQAGQMLKIESEFVLVIEVNDIANVLTVKRAYNGTVAASHDKDTTIYIYRPYEKIRDCVLRMATWRFRQKDTMNVQDQVYVMGNGTVVKPGELDIAELLPPKRPIGLMDTENL